MFSFSLVSAPLLPLALLGLFVPPLDLNFRDFAVQAPLVFPVQVDQLLRPLLDHFLSAPLLCLEPLPFLLHPLAQLRLALARVGLDPPLLFAFACALALLQALDRLVPALDFLRQGLFLGALGPRLLGLALQIALRPPLENLPLELVLLEALHVALDEFRVLALQRLLLLALQLASALRLARLSLPHLPLPREHLLEVPLLRPRLAFPPLLALAHLPLALLEHVAELQARVEGLHGVPLQEQLRLRFRVEQPLLFALVALFGRVFPAPLFLPPPELFPALVFLLPFLHHQRVRPLLRARLRQLCRLPRLSAHPSAPRGRPGP